jgi:adenylosuccinate synthase
MPAPSPSANGGSDCLSELQLLMSTTRYAAVLGLGFGDCGKGHFIDALTRRWQAHTVVRFNGGAQAGHNVVAPAEGNSPARHHTFSQFGAGTFVPGVHTLLVNPMIVHPTALLVEAEALGRLGITDALSRLTIDARCRITTPFHQAAGRLRELLRGASAHGTCGVGVGETVRHALEHPEQELRYEHLPQFDTANTRTPLDRLQAIRETLLREFSPQCPKGSAALSAEFQTLQDETLATRWLASARALARHCPPAPPEVIQSRLQQPGCVLFEGAQGVLLDEWRGFHPHTTWSSINTAAVNEVVTRFEIESPVDHYGVIRTYLTRHGAGPFPTHDATLEGFLPEPHNNGDNWQGHFRRGHPDAVLLRYALESVGQLSGLLISHLDVFQGGRSLRWCAHYSVASSSGQWPRFVERLPLVSGQDLDHQLSLTHLLQSARPQYAAEPVYSASDFIDRVSSITSLPVILTSYGATHADVFSPFEWQHTR